MDSRDTADTTPKPGSPLFRDEALEHYLDEGNEGALLRASPAWANWTYRLLLSVTAIAVAYIALASVPVYESGPALLRVADAAAINAPLAGTIESVDVLPGQRVAAGQILAKFRAEQESASLERAQAEFELQLLARLRDPTDSESEGELRRLRPEVERARLDLERTRLVAPRDGAVQDVRIRPGDYLEVGEQALTLTPAVPEFAVIAFMPGHVLPQLETGMKVRLKIAGYAYAELETSIESIGSQVIGPAEARRFLGPEIGDAVDLRGSVVVVRAVLEDSRFVSGSDEYRVHDGMNAMAEVEVRRERLIFRLIPALRGFSERG